MKDLKWLTVGEIGAAYAGRQLSPVELVQTLLAEIEARNPDYGAFIRVDAEGALSAARVAEAAIASGRRLGPLHGVPIGVKDNIDVAGLPTTCHSKILLDNIAREDAAAIGRLRAAGAILLGKQSLHEFAFGGPSQELPFPYARHPWNTDYHPGGSSSGSGVALAAGFVPLSLGTDAGGSIRNPAGNCGVVGLKPTYDLVSRHGVFPVAFTLDHVGPMARCVADVALMLDAEAHHDAGDPLSLPPPDRPFSEAVRNPRPPKRVGYTSNLGIGEVDAEVAAICQQVVQKFSEFGAEVDDDHPDFSGGFESFQTLRATLFAAVRGPLLDQHRDQICPEIIWNIEKGLQQDGATMARAERLRGELFLRVVDFFGHHDILACPTVAVSPFPVDQRYPKEINGQELTSYIDWMYLTFVLTLTGCPVISVPVGITREGMPVGLQIMGRPRADADVLAAAQLMEQTGQFAAMVPRLVKTSPIK